MALPFHGFLFRIFAGKYTYFRNPLSYVCKRFLNESYYEILKVPETCSSKDVREAFINLSKKNHPDKHINDPSMHERFIRINEAYSVLINPLSRKAYDITLHQKKKLGEPKTVIYKQPRWTHESSDSSFSSTSYDTHTKYTYRGGDPYMWNFQNRSKERKSSNDIPYYGVSGLKKVSNLTVATILIIFAFFAVGFQLLMIRRSALRNQEIMLERSQKNAMILSMAREKAKMFGNEYQLNLLKQSLKGSIDAEEKPQVTNTKDPTLSSPQVKNVTNSSVDDADTAASCPKCKKCKNM